MVALSFFFSPLNSIKCISECIYYIKIKLTLKKIGYRKNTRKKNEITVPTTTTKQQQPNRASVETSAI